MNAWYAGCDDLVAESPAWLGRGTSDARQPAVPTPVNQLVLFGDGDAVTVPHPSDIDVLVELQLHRCGASPRECDVARLIMTGLTSYELIAAHLGISASTVHHHRRHLYIRTGALDQLQLLLYLLDRRPLCPDDPVTGRVW